MTLAVTGHRPHKLGGWNLGIHNALIAFATDRLQRDDPARMIAKLAAAEKKTVAEFVMSPQTIYRDRIVEKTVYRDRPADPKPDPSWSPADDFRREARKARKKAKPPEDENLIDGLRWARNFPEHLTGWEAEFISDILMRSFDDDDLTYNQQKAARRVIARVKACEGEPLI